MKPKTLILMVVAVVCGLGASYMTSRLLSERDEAPVEAPPIEKVNLIVAKKNLEMHTSLGKKPEDFFVEKSFVKDDAPKDALTLADLPKLKGKFVRRGLRKGDHILAEDVMDGTFGLRQLPDGMRAVGIRVNPEQIAGGFASLPGSHVDILWTTRRDGSDTMTRVLLEDVVVLAADAQTNTDSGGGAMVANVVTVALSPDDTTTLTCAMETGAIRLVVRNLQDVSTHEKAQINFGDLVKGGKTAKLKDIDPIVAVLPPPEPPKADTPEKAPEPEKKLYKKQITVRNGSDVQVIYYWVDENDVRVGDANSDPEQSLPAPKGKKDEKKDGNYY